MSGPESQPLETMFGMNRYKVPDIPDDSPLWLIDAQNEALDHARLIGEFGTGVCVYCSHDAEEADHLVPIPVSGKALRRYVPTLPACQPCNATLGAFPAPIVASRAHYIAHRLRLTKNFPTIERRLDRWIGEDEELFALSWMMHRYGYLEAGGVVRAVRRGLLPCPTVDSTRLMAAI